jgi:hypothetical protein
MTLLLLLQRLILQPTHIPILLALFCLCSWSCTPHTIDKLSFWWEVVRHHGIRSSTSRCYGCSDSPSCCSITSLQRSAASRQRPLACQGGHPRCWPRGCAFLCSAALPARWGWRLAVQSAPPAWCAHIGPAPLPWPGQGPTLRNPKHQAPQHPSPPPCAPTRDTATQCSLPATPHGLRLTCGRGLEAQGRPGPARSRNRRRRGRPGRRGRRTLGGRGDAAGDCGRGVAAGAASAGAGADMGAAAAADSGPAATLGAAGDTGPGHISA